MSMGMSNGEIGCYEAELLPARTVLSVRTAGIQDFLSGNNGSNGTNGTAGNDGGTGHAKGLGLFGWLQQAGPADPDTATASSGAAAGTSAPS
jgi:hypothetical protein